MTPLTAAAAAFWLVWFPRTTDQPPVVLHFPTYELCRLAAYAYEPENSKWWTPEEWEERRRRDRVKYRRDEEQRRVFWMKHVQQHGAAVLDEPDWVKTVDHANVWGTGGAAPFVSLVGILPTFERRLVGDCQEGTGP